MKKDFHEATPKQRKQAMKNLKSLGLDEKEANAYLDKLEKDIKDERQ